MNANLSLTARFRLFLCVSSVELGVYVVNSPKASHHRGTEIHRDTQRLSPFALSGRICQFQSVSMALRRFHCVEFLK